ncbi:hypothetical protein NFI96_032155, partial [Prochilodus magdalenae]
VNLQSPSNNETYQERLERLEGDKESLVLQFGDGPFLFQHDRTPVHRASSIKTWMSESGVEELDWPAQSPDLSTERQAFLSKHQCLTSQMLLLEEWSGIPINTFLTLWKAFPEELKLVSVLTEQVEAQGEKIRDLEVSLEEHHHKLLSTEEMLQQLQFCRARLRKFSGLELTLHSAGSGT